jgi:predicted alpha/beta-fold hydrolase
MTFRPLPFLGNPHVQTVLGSLWKGRGVRLPTQLHLVPLPDGSSLAVHDTIPPDWQPDKPIVLMVHGLGGSHQSPMLQRLVNRFTLHGFRAVRVDLRGAGAGIKQSRRVYNAADADDVRAVAEFLSGPAPGAPLYLVGVSLGGNLVLNLAGSAAARPLPSLRMVAAISPPIDLTLCSAMLATLPFYDHFYARNLRRQVDEHQACFPDLPVTPFPKRLTMRLFDDLYTAPRGGFADALDYYRRASSKDVIPEIKVPTFILSARDDPFIAVPPIENLPAQEYLHVRLVARGGHLGFLGRDGNGGLRWAEQQLVAWILKNGI